MVAKNLAEHWHWKKMQHRAFKEFTDTTKCCTVTTEFLNEIAHLDGKESDEDLNIYFSAFDLNRKEFSGYEAKLSQFFHPAIATSIWKSIAFVLLSVLTFGIYYAISTMLLWRNFHRGEDALHRTLTNASRTMKADGDLANALLLSRILLLIEKLFKCYPVPSRSADMDAVNAAYDEWSNKDLRFLLSQNGLLRPDDGLKTDKVGQSPPHDADGAMRKFLSLCDTSNLNNFKPAYAFRDEVKQNFSVHAKDFGMLLELIRQRGALRKLEETTDGSLWDATHLIESQAMACDELNLGSSKFLLGDVKILFERIRKGEGVAPDKADLKAKFSVFKAAISKKVEVESDIDETRYKVEFLELFTRKSSHISSIAADEFLLHFLDGLLGEIGRLLAGNVFYNSEEYWYPGNSIYLENIPKEFHVDSFYELAAPFAGCCLQYDCDLLSSRDDLEIAIFEECKKNYKTFQNFFQRRRQKLEASPEQRERVAAIGKSAEDEIRKTFLPTALGISAPTESEQPAK